ncbi:1-(5-phosphoribosyl)-5-[(5-phosphoribosylamino)methylideneamino] imidazole-4-carboxamide isomerase [Desulfobacterium sp. N47]|uniref:1-(5-phosphoribosyl)-5-[(5-phosphoribosylamino)methylideneamino] imidazole-4-carboxamide isomerase n=1 Tax=uncultured Desulfobacterium sp. TaxID=201089 RepID=E1YKT2_9BACT|nr:1-(5-phosphoribosyl)-5-[(5-phosphoribosylamino)methylideneamino] imidazole-4-carbox [uncultured Desulfobacterium sp.]
MIIIPAVDIKNGKCVRLLQGQKDRETVFSDDPSAMAQKWEKQGAELIHVVDLDGAFEKSPVNLLAIKKILSCAKVDIQVGGGIRNENTAKMFFDIGVKRIVIGTEAHKNPKWVKNICRQYPSRVVVGIDAKNGLVAIEGWTETTGMKAVDLAKNYEDCSVAAINFTDIYRDGMQTGPNIEETRRLAEAVNIPVVASGGVSTIEDIKNLLSIEKFGVTGVITGKAIYSGSLDFREALKISGRKNQ